jgi:hypothetical protein
MIRSVHEEACLIEHLRLALREGAPQHMATPSSSGWRGRSGIGQEKDIKEKRDLE